MMPKISHRYKKISKIIIQLIDCKINVLNSYHKYGTVNPRKEEKRPSVQTFQCCGSASIIMRIRIRDPQMSLRIRGGNHKIRKITPKFLN